MYRNPKKIKKEIKMVFFYLIDGIIVLATFGIGNALMENFNLSPFMQLVSYALFFLLGIWFCIRTPNHPVDRNIQMVFHYLRANRNRYHDFYKIDYSSTTLNRGGKLNGSQNKTKEKSR